MWCNNNGMCTRTQLCTVRLKRFQFAESCRGWNFPLKLDDTRMCACLSQITFCNRGCGLHPLPPESSFPSVLVVSSLPVSPEVTFWHKAGNSLSARVDHVKACNRLEHMQRSGRAPVVTQPAMYRQSKSNLYGFKWISYHSTLSFRS